MNTTANKVNTGVNFYPANLKGMAKHTYNRVMSAMAEDNDRYMGHTFADLTDGTKALVHNSGHFANLYIRGKHKGMAAEEAAKELTERAAAITERKLRNIDMICAVAFLAEYISRQRKADEPTTTEPTNTPSTMNANETKAANIVHAESLYNRIDAMNERGAWNNGVKTYALMLLGWYIAEAAENALTLNTMLNGANDWYHYSRSGCGVALCYNARIAETLCSPSELKRVKGGAKNPNSREDWCDVEGRALVQAWRLIETAEMLVSANM